MEESENIVINLMAASIHDGASEKLRRARCQICTRACRESQPKQPYLLRLLTLHMRTVMRLGQG